MNETMITVVGNVVTEVRLGNTKGDGTPVASFRVASTSRRYDRQHGAWVDGETNYFTVSCWRQMAANVSDSLRKGDPVVVTGRLRVRPWEAGERRGTTVELEATGLGHDIGRGVSAFTRRRRGEAVPTEATRVVDKIAREFDAQAAGERAPEEVLDARLEAGFPAGSDSESDPGFTEPVSAVA